MKRARVDPDDTVAENSANEIPENNANEIPEILFRLGPGLRPSKKGELYGLLLVDDEGFTYNMSNIKKNICYWYCSERKKFNCDARIHTAIPNVTREELIKKEHKIPGEIIKGHRFHEIQVGKFEKRKLVASFKNDCTSKPMEPVNSLITKNKKDITDEIRAAIPDNLSFRRMAFRQRQPQLKGLNATNVMDIVINGEYEDFVIEDLKENESRTFIFGRNIAILNEYKEWAMDATFFVVPKGFYQLLTIGPLIKQKCFPIIYCLMQNKKKNSYIKIFNSIKNKDVIGPRIVVCDFEVSMMNAFTKVFEGSVPQTCFFHHCQATLTKMRKLQIIPHYRALNRVRNIYRLSMALAFLPIDLVIRGFYLIIPEQTDQRTKSYLHYFKKTYIGMTQIEVDNGEDAFAPPELPNPNEDGTGNDTAQPDDTLVEIPNEEEPIEKIDQINARHEDQIVKTPNFPISLWNMMTDRIKNKISRTNNSTEASHQALQKRTNGHPNFGKFLEAICKFYEDTMENFNDARIKGVKRQKKQCDLDSRIITLTSELEDRRKLDGKIETDYLLDYMKRIAYACMDHFNAQVLLEEEIAENNEKNEESELEYDANDTVTFYLENKEGHDGSEDEDDKGNLETESNFSEEL